MPNKTELSFRNGFNEMKGKIETFYQDAEKKNQQENKKY